MPPVLLVRQKDGSAIYLLLVSADGKPVNQQVLDLVAEPVQITGEVERQGELLILRADPATYRRVQLQKFHTKRQTIESSSPTSLDPQTGLENFPLRLRHHFFVRAHGLAGVPRIVCEV